MILLGSHSKSRQALLAGAGFTYRVVGHEADEALCCTKETIQETVSEVALHKMNHVVIPQWYEQDYALLLTADTLGIDTSGCIVGKPRDKAQAREYIRQKRGIISCSTAFCLNMKRRKSDRWITAMEHLEVVTIGLELDVPEERLDEYIEQTNALQASGAVCVGGFGAQFVKYIDGSYTGLLGLPMFELRQALLRFLPPT